MMTSTAWLTAIQRCPISSLNIAHYWGPAACKCQISASARKACPIRSLDPSHYHDETCGCGDGRTSPVWTVVGYWSDEPIPVGVIAGEHDVTGGQDATGEGLWATSVLASDASEAEIRAIAVMEGRNDD